MIINDSQILYALIAPTILIIWTVTGLVLYYLEQRKK